MAFLALAWQNNRTGARDQAQPGDAIVVLGARVELDGLPGPDLRSRTLPGVRLFQRGLAPYLVCTGGYQDDRLSTASVACNLAISQGVPAERVLLTDGSMTTQEDAIAAGSLLAKYGMHTAILVSHPLQWERARLLFEAQGVTRYPSPTSTDLEGIPWISHAWQSSREATGIVFIALGSWGLPSGWTTQLIRWVYGPLQTPGSGAN